MSRDLILGTAGHIDHGKTSLVKALTGIDCDRLPEEQRRGITIELGFAELTLGEYRLGIVDVPGHERFVRNMLSGATGMDLAMLVVAADDSIKQQTREHMEILRLLDLRSGVIALTKVDLAESTWLDLVEAEIRELVASSFLAEATIVRVSSVTGEGLNELREALTLAADRVWDDGQARRLAVPFRLAIDRAFTVEGYGTVVTGSVSSGAVTVGELLTLEPGGVEVRVRGLQNHDRPVDRVERGQRAAINLTGVHHADINRGQELAAPGSLRSSKLITVQLQLLENSPVVLKNRASVRAHLGTAELLARVVLLEADKLSPGEMGLAQLYLESPAATTWNQPLVLRSESPVTTIGGGRVLQPVAKKLKQADAETLACLRGLLANDPVERTLSAAYLEGWNPWGAEDLFRLAGVDDCATTYAALATRGEIIEIRVSPVRTLRIHRRVLDRLGDQIAEHLHDLHERFPLKLAIERTRVATDFAWVGEDAVLQAALARLQASGRVKIGPRGIVLAGHGPKLSANEQKLLDRILDRFRTAGFEPPSVAQLQGEAERIPQAVPQLLALAVASDELVECGPGVYLHADNERRLRELLSEKLAASPGLTVSQIREILGTTRKFAVPLCEYLDHIGLTRREGDGRVLAGPTKV